MSRTQHTRKDRIIELVAYTHTTDENDNPKKVPTKNPVCASVQSVKRSEFYFASGAGMRPEAVFVVWKREYADQEAVEYNGKEYKVIRTHEPNKEDVELVCSGPGPRQSTRG